ncbi:MAG: MFS transporter, partial [Gammaproteobacteria bacterium]|nr:MFS transporter [Gammaproteobacteria bacterium]
MAYASFGFVAASVAPMVAPIEAELGLSHAAMGSIMGAWQLVYIFSAVPCGLLLDRIGGRRALLIGILLIAASGLGRALAVDYWTFLLAVMLFGLGGPIISSGAPKLVAALFTGSQRGMAMGIYMTGPAFGGVACLGLTNSWLLPLLGSWRQVMLLWAGVALAAAVIWWALGRAFAIDPDKASSRPAPQAMPGDGSPQLALMAELWRTPAVRLVLVMRVAAFLFNHGLNG